MNCRIDSPLPQVPYPYSYRHRQQDRAAIRHSSDLFLPFLPLPFQCPHPPISMPILTLIPNLMPTWKQSPFHLPQLFSILPRQSRIHCRPKQFPRTRRDRLRSLPVHIRRPRSRWVGSRSQNNPKVAMARNYGALPPLSLSSSDVHCSGLISSQGASHAKQSD